MPQQNPSSTGAGGQQAQAPLQLATFALRALGQACELNLSASRALLQTQARAASAVGWPDWSPLFDAVDEPTRRLLSVNTDQWVTTAQRAGEVASQLQREVERLVETQATNVVQAVEQGLQKLGSQAEQTFDQLAETAQQQAQAMDQIAKRAGDEQGQSVVITPGHENGSSNHSGTTGLGGPTPGKTEPSSPRKSA